MEGVGRPSAFVTVLLAVAAVVLVAVVATGERVPIATDDADGPSIERRPDRFVPDPANPVQRVRPSPIASDPTDAGVLSVLLQAVLILGCIVLVALVAVALVRLWRRAAVADDERPPEEDTPEEHWPREAPAAMAAAVDEGLSALRSGPPDEVIVACWVRLEDAAADAGVARSVGETPSELASRVLADLHAPSRAVGELLTRYRIARYSRHPLDEDDRTVAIRSLEQVRQAIAGARR